ncbi:MAG: hypothetical protein JWQ04_3187 [Pedosphaera sp.]|nr:hypothetical protein [Pedosphaera sp.]
MLPNSKSPAIAFNSKAAQLKKERGISWSEAYAAVMKEFPDLWEAMPDTDSFKQILKDGLLKNRAKAATRFNKLVLNRQAADNSDFETAYDRTRRAEPELFKFMAGE